MALFLKQNVSMLGLTCECFHPKIRFSFLLRQLSRSVAFALRCNVLEHFREKSRNYPGLK